MSTFKLVLVIVAGFEGSRVGIRVGERAQLLKALAAGCDFYHPHSSSQQFAIPVPRDLKSSGLLNTGHAQGEQKNM